MDRIKTITSKIAEAEHEVDGIRDQEELLDMEVTSQKWLARIGGMKKDAGAVYDDVDEHSDPPRVDEHLDGDAACGTKRRRGRSRS